MSCTKCKSITITTAFRTSRSSFVSQTEIRQPGVFTGFVGGIAGIPPDYGAQRAGLGRSQSAPDYTVTMIKNGVVTDLTKGKTLYAVPSNVGPLTMPDYDALFNQGVDDLGNNVRVFAGTVDDPFYIDLGAAFDSLNFRMGVGGILSPASMPTIRTTTRPTLLRATTSTPSCWKSPSPCSPRMASCMARARSKP